MTPFDFVSPVDAAGAEAAWAEGEGAALYLAGGQSLLAALKMRLAQPSALIDLSRLPELRQIRRETESLIIGGAVTHAEIAALTDCPALAETAAAIGDLQIRNRGTLGGALANADPACDHAAAVLGLGAEIRTRSRAIKADDFFLGMFETALEPGELIVEVAFPLPRRAAYASVRNPASGYPVAGVFAAETASGHRVAVTGAASAPFRLSDFEAALDRGESVEGLVAPDMDYNRDLHASAEYRAHLVGVLARRALERLR